jgi:hypothetical protein
VNSDDRSIAIEILRPGATLALISVLLGFAMGGAFGVAEDSIKHRLKSSGQAVTDSVYAGDTAKRDAVVKKSWVYMKRAHLHWGAIGAAALGAIAMLALMGSGGALDRYSAIAFGAGAIAYGLFWLFSALAAPGLGSTGAAKESMQLLGIPGAGLCIAGVSGALVSVAKGFFGR